jgi:phenylalanine-4-hydroxylase
MAVYEAVRSLSIVKEIPSASKQEIAAAEEHLKSCSENNNIPSESALLARLHWWTVEYGLVGKVEDYRIYGAGLLSSLGESQQCLDDDTVTKLALTVDAINTSYDITAAQPQLFVTESCRHLSQVLEVYGKEMCYLRGGSSALQEAIEAKTVNTAVPNSGIQGSGMFSASLSDAVGNTIYYNTSGGTQLAYQGEELFGHGINYHAAGFGSPLGRLRGLERCLSDYTVDELKRHQIELGTEVELQYLSGIQVRGTLIGLIRKNQKNILMTFTDCTVLDAANNTLFDPSWGNFDMAIGDEIISIEGGSADISKFPLYSAPSNTAAALIEYDDAMKAVFADYQQVREYRKAIHGKKGTHDHEGTPDKKDLESFAASILAKPDADWLLIYETLELAIKFECAEADQQTLVERLKTIQSTANEEVTTLINHALNRQLGL